MQSGLVHDILQIAEPTQLRHEEKKSLPTSMLNIIQEEI